MVKNTWRSTEPHVKTRPARRRCSTSHVFVVKSGLDCGAASIESICCTAAYSCCTYFQAARSSLTPPTRLAVAAANQPGARMAEGPEFRTTMHFAYGVPRELAPGVRPHRRQQSGPVHLQGHQHLYCRQRRSRADRSRPRRSRAPESHSRMHRAAPAQPRAHHPHAPRSHRRAARAACSHRRQDGRLRPQRARRAAPSAPVPPAASSSTRTSRPMFRLPTADGLRATAGLSRPCTRPGMLQTICVSRSRAPRSSSPATT